MVVLLEILDSLTFVLPIVELVFPLFPAIPLKIVRKPNLALNYGFE